MAPSFQHYPPEFVQDMLGHWSKGGLITAMMVGTAIRVAYTLGIGRIEVDPSMIRGEGGALNPQLVLPIKIRMEPWPGGEGIEVALVRLVASLHQGAQPFPVAPVSDPVDFDLLNEMPCRTLGSFHRGTTHDMELRFRLTLAQVHALDAARNEQPESALVLSLGFTGVTAFLHAKTEHLPIGNEQSMAVNSSKIEPLWNTTIDPLTLSIDRLTWAEKALAGMGYDRVRLIEVQVPPRLPEQGGATAAFDKARRELDAHRPDDCIAACRAIRNAWEKFLGAKKDKPDRVVDKVAQRYGWAETSARFKLLECTWKNFVDITNEPHHGGQFTLTDARFCLMLTAILSEYVADLVGA